MNDCRTFYADTPNVLPAEESSLSLSSDEEVYPPIGLHSNKSQSVVSDRMICAGGYPEGGKGICRVSSSGFCFFFYKVLMLMTSCRVGCYALTSAALGIDSA